MAEYNLGTARGRIELDYKSGAAAQAGKDVESIGTKSNDSSKKLDKAAKGMAIAGGAIAVGIGLAVKSAANFEQGLANISAVTGITGKGMDEVRDKALQLGKDTKFSAGEAATAIEELAKAGIAMPDILNGAADATVALAAAGSIALPEAATIASNAMNQFGLSAKAMPGVADAIAGAANASAIDVSEFGMSLAQVGAVAHLAGLDFKDTAVAIAEMGNAGIKGSDAGTSLKTFLQNLIPVTDKQVGLFEELGLLAVNTGTAMQTLASKGIRPASDSFNDIIEAIEKYREANGETKAGTEKARKEALAYAQSLGVVQNQFFDATGKTKNLAAIQEVLGKSLKGMTKEQKLATLQTLFGSDAIRAAAVLADQGAAGFNKMAAGMDKVKAADVAAVKMNTLSGTMEALQGSLETLAIQLGQVLVPALNSIAKVLTVVVNFFLTLPGPVQKAIVYFALAAASALLVGAAFIKTVKFVKEFRAAVLALRELAAMSKLMSLIFGPWGLAILAVIALAILIWKNWDTIKAALIAIWNAIKAAFVATWNAIWSAIQPIVNAIWAFIKTVFDAIAAYFTFVFNIYKTIITTAINVILAVWKAIWGAFGPLITAYFKLIYAVVKLYIMIVAAIIYQTIRAILAVWRAVWGQIKAILGPILTFIWNLVKTVFGGIKSAITSVMEFLKPYVSTAVGAIKTVFLGIVSIVTKVIGFFQSIYTGVVDKVRALLTFVGGIAGKILNAIGNLGRLLYDKGKEIIQGLIDGITAMIGKVTDAVGKVTGVVGKFLPGSPVKEGPLRVLNNGYAGGQIAKMLASGIAEQEPLLRGVMMGLTTNITPVFEAGVQNTASSAALMQTPVASKVVNVDVTNYNPIAEYGSVSTSKSMTRLAQLEVI